jgi:hypothetical protein
MNTPTCKKWKIGDHYLDCGRIPRVVIGISYERIFPQGVRCRTYDACADREYLRRLAQEGLQGRSLIDGSIGHCSIRHCSPDKVHRKIAERWAKTGPLTSTEKLYLKSFYASEWGAGRTIWWKE